MQKNLLSMQGWKREGLGENVCRETVTRMQCSDCEAAFYLVGSNVISRIFILSRIESEFQNLEEIFSSLNG